MIRRSDAQKREDIREQAKCLVEMLEALTIREASRFYGGNWAIGMLEWLERLTAEESI